MRKEEWSERNSVVYKREQNGWRRRGKTEKRLKYREKDKLDDNGRRRIGKCTEKNKLNVKMLKGLEKDSNY